MKSSFAKYSTGKVEWLGADSTQTSLADMTEIKTNEIKSLMVKKYNKKVVSYEQVLDENIDSTPYLESQLIKALKELEQEGILYIERFPKLGQNGKPLTSIKPTAILYFNTFPNIERKTLLYETKVEYGNFTINHVFGCSHGCCYPCYAFMMAKHYGKARDYEDWIHPRIVSNALDLLEKEIPKYKNAIDFVHLSFTTDPFMYNIASKNTYSSIENLTLKIIEKLNLNGLKVTVLTKGLYPKILIDKDKFDINNEYGITLVSLSDKFKSKYEPFTAPLNERIQSLETLHNNGLKTWVSIEPYPTPNIVKQDFKALLERISFVDKIIFGKMNYNSESTKFEKAEEFYNECSETLIEFCQKNNKKYHIKKGTPNNRESTMGIFKEET